MNRETFLQSLDANTEEIRAELARQRGRQTELEEEQERVERLIFTLEGRLVQNGDIRRYMEASATAEQAPQAEEATPQEG